MSKREILPFSLSFHSLWSPLPHKHKHKQLPQNRTHNKNEKVIIFFFFFFWLAGAYIVSINSRLSHSQQCVCACACICICIYIYFVLNANLQTPLEQSSVPLMKLEAVIMGPRIYWFLPFFFNQVEALLLTIFTIRLAAV